MVKKIEKLPGVADVQLNYGAGIIKVNHSGPLEAILGFIESNGYRAGAAKDGNGPVDLSGGLRVKKILTAMSGVLLFLGIAGGWAGVYAGLLIPLFAASMVTGGLYVYRSAAQSLRSLVFDMNVLMSVSSIGAVFIGEWAEAATVVFLFSVGNMLQAHTLEKTRESVKKMMELAPREARLLLPSGAEKTVPVELVRTGERVLIKPGEYIPVDGTVVKGMSWADQSPITGESKPVEKSEGDMVFAGSLNSSGSLEVVVSSIASDSTLARMIHLVEEAQAKRAPAQHFVDTFARYYTPAVLVAALLAVAVPVVVFGRPFTEWFYRALVLLVISCPCALVISTPVSIVSAIGNCARNGILVKGGAYLEALARVTKVAFDKTGTLTTGRMALDGIYPAEGFSEEELLEMAAVVEQRSEHPLARAVMAEAGNRGLELPEPEGFMSFPGRGASCYLEGDLVRAGNFAFIREEVLETHGFDEVAQGLEESGRSVVYVSRGGRLAGLLAVADTPRAEAGVVIKRLREMGITAVTMLSGDSEKTVAGIARQLGIDSYHAALLPEQKVKQVEELAQSGVTVMVGDGVNDAPALAAASVGMAMGSAGSATALETADIALMNDELAKIPALIEISRSTLRIIQQNVAVAIALKLVFLIMTIAGLSNLWMAVFADTGASVLVTLNGMRLARFRFR